MFFFDLGIGNGLKNKISESLAKDDVCGAREYISTSYTVIGISLALIYCLFFIISFIVPWGRFFNTTILNHAELVKLINICALLIFLNFWLGLISQIANAVQKASLVVFGQFMSNAFALVFIVLINLFTKTSLTYMAISYGGALITSNIALSYLFYKKHSNLRPKYSFNMNYVKPLLSLGIQFFFIQLAVLIIFSTDKILITQLFGPEFVSNYDITYKMFSIITIIHGLINAPLWSSYSDAYHRSDFKWIEKCLKKQLIIMMFVVIGSGVLVLLSKPLFAIWIGDNFKVDHVMVLSISLFVMIATWNNIFCNSIKRNR